jgi:hypothetical protein
MLAHPYKPAKHDVAGGFASEKLDGQRCLYVPGTRGLMKSEVPFANLAKDERYLEDYPCSGLWSRYGNVIYAPDYWLDELPETFLDGELFLRRGKGGRQELRKIISDRVPDEEDWEAVSYRIFDLPSPETLFQEREINVPNFEKSISGCLEWWLGLGRELIYRPVATTPFRSTSVLIERLCGQSAYAHAHKQVQLSFSTETAKLTIDKMVETIVERDGEGIVIRHPDSCYEVKRSHKLLKVKDLNDDEATVIGYVTGRKTDKGSKLLGLMGALVLDWNGVVFELSGFTDAERALVETWEQGEQDRLEGSALRWAEDHPAAACPDWIEAVEFPRGTTVTFKYRDTNTSGAPNEARYWRKRGEE